MTGGRAVPYLVRWASEPPHGLRMPDQVVWAQSVEEAFDLALEPLVRLSCWREVESVRPMLAPGPEEAPAPASIEKVETARQADPVLLVDLERAGRLCDVGKTVVEEHWNAGRLTKHTSNGRPGGKRLVDPFELKAVMALTEESDENAIAERLLAELTAED